MSAPLFTPVVFPAAVDPFANLAAMSAAWDEMADATLRRNDPAYSAAKARFDAARDAANCGRIS